ncbi:type II toxin-antitoxin system VapB family antitoxin [Hyphobacterium sp.]|uniref:type II toxin-antitoxin system VapB family antitoxin n=1 Tax=Hyphobacterium sp. TaxID=2004662 RepID=UPI003BAD80A1
MTLSIKDPETDRLARKLAELSGQNITEAVRAALEAEIARREREANKKAKAEKIREILRRFPRDEFAGLTSADHDFLYGEDGLPE